MSRRSRVGRDPFGLSLLDMLCCSFGAMILLIVLNQQVADERLERAERVADGAYRVWSEAHEVWKRADAERSEAELGKERAVARAEGARGRTALYEGIGKSLPSGPAPPTGRREFLPAAGGRRALVLLDCSGSMVRFSREEELPGGAACPPKWRRAIESIERFLLQQRDLQLFAVMAIDDGRRRPLSDSRIHPPDRPWASAAGEVGLSEIGKASRALFERRPSGGAAHGWTFERVFEEYLGERASAADVILIVTDGLPNRARLMEPSPAGSAWVPVEDKRRFADDALSIVAQSAVRLGDRMPPIHVICLEWPDDIELLNFALSIAGKTGGFVGYVPSGGGEP